MENGLEMMGEKEVKERSEIDNAMFSIGWLTACIRTAPDGFDKLEAQMYLDRIEKFILNTIKGK